MKLNVRCRSTGHIIEIQLHLQPFYDLKSNGGHDHYTWSRTLKVDGVTNAVSILQGLNQDLLEDICDYGIEKLANAETEEKK